MVLAIGAFRPARTITSNTLNPAQQNQLEPPAMIGFISSANSPKFFDAIRISWDFIQLDVAL